MSQYLTTGEDLTSIANAIRAKTGENSSLIYPTGFVNKIGELSKYTYVGASPEVEWESNDIVLTLADTTLPSWTPSTSATNIFTPTQVNSSLIYLDHDKHYLISCEIYSNFIYTTTPTVAHLLESYYTGVYHFDARPNTVSNFLDNTRDWVTYAIAPGVLFHIYTNTSGTLSVTNNQYGIYYGTEYPRLSNQNKATIGCNIYMPSIRAVANNNYMHADAFGLLDLNNSNINIKLRVYSASNTMMTAMNERIRELYSLNHNIT